MFKKIIIFVLVSFFVFQSFNVFADYKDVLKTKIDHSLQKVANKYTLSQKKKFFPTLIQVLQKKKAGKNQRLIDYIIQVLQTYIQDDTGNNNLKDIYGFENIDMHKFKLAWLSWLNKSRAEKGLSPLTFEHKLDISAQAWAETLKSRYHNGPSSINWNDVHKRNLSDGYYDYWKITNWMKNHGVIAKNINGLTFTENIGYGVLKCPSKGDCTNKAINSTKVSYNSLYVKEKSYNGVHYRGLMKKSFKKVGFGFVVDNKGYYWIVIHYATEVE